MMKWKTKMSDLVCAAMVIMMMVGGSSSVWASSSASVDWDKGVISAIAMTDPMAQHGRTVGQKVVLARVAALGMAESYLLGAVKGVKINRATTIKEAILTGDVIEKKIEGTIKGAMVIEEGINELDLYEVTVAVRIEEVAETVMTGLAKTTGSAFGLLDKSGTTPVFRRNHRTNREHLGVSEDAGEEMTLKKYIEGKLNKARISSPVETSYVPARFTSKSASSSDTGFSVTNYAPVAASSSLKPITNYISETADKASDGDVPSSRPVLPEITLDLGNESGYTSLIIDGRELKKLTRSTSPAVYSEDGSLIYQGANISYYSGLLEALRSSEAGSKPYVIDVFGEKNSGDTKKSKLIISSTDAHNLQMANNEGRFLDSGRVMILTR